MLKCKLWTLVTAAAVVVLLSSPSWAVYTLSQSGWTSGTVSGTFDDWARWDREYAWRAERYAAGRQLYKTSTADYPLDEGDWWLSPGYNEDVDQDGTVTVEERQGRVIDGNGDHVADYTASYGGYFGYPAFGDLSNMALGTTLYFERGRIEVTAEGTADFFHNATRASGKRWSFGFRYDYDSDGTDTWVVIPLPTTDPDRPGWDGVLDLRDPALFVDTDADGTKDTDYRVPEGGYVDAVVLFTHYDPDWPGGAFGPDFNGDGVTDAWVKPDPTWGDDPGARDYDKANYMGITNYKRLVWDSNGDGTLDDLDLDLDGDGTNENCFDVGDVNADGAVDSADRDYIDMIFNTLGGGSNVLPTSYFFNRGADITGDDLVNQDDRAHLLQAVGRRVAIQTFLLDVQRRKLAIEARQGAKHSHVGCTDAHLGFLFVRTSRHFPDSAFLTILPPIARSAIAPSARRRSNPAVSTRGYRPKQPA